MAAEQEELYLSSSSSEEHSYQEEELTAEESLATAKEHDREGSTEDALLCFGHALQLAVEAAGDETAPECAAYYFAYGDALMTAEDATAKELGAAEEEPEEPAAGGGEAVRPNSPGGRERPEDDIELAWEMLEGARVCYSKQPDTADRRDHLADVHSRLGDVMQANEMFAQAITEYTRAHRLREQALAEGGAATDAGGAAAAAAAAAAPPSRSRLQRAIAAELCNIGRALQWSVPPRTDDAVASYGKAHALVEQLRADESPDEDEAELFELSEGISGKIVELGGEAPTCAPSRKRKAADGGGDGAGGAALPPPGMRGSSGATCHEASGLKVMARWLGGRSSAGYVVAETARLTVLLPGTEGAGAGCRGRVDRWGWGDPRDFDAVEDSAACVDWDDGFDEEDDGDEGGAGEGQRYIAVRNGGGAAVRQLVFEVAEEDEEGDDDEEAVHAWPDAWLGALGSPAEGGIAELYSNDLCRLTTCELLADGAYTCNFDSSNEKVVALLLNLGTTECSIRYDAGGATHSAVLPVLLPSAPTSEDATAAEQADQCLLLDSTVGTVTWRLAAGSAAPLQLGVLQLRKKPPLG